MIYIVEYAYSSSWGALAIISISVKQAQVTLAWLLFAVLSAIIGTSSVLWLVPKHIPYAVAVFLVVASMATVLVTMGILLGA